MSRYVNPTPQIIDGNGKPIIGAKKFLFTPGGVIKKTIYTDSGFTTPAANPSLSDADGRFDAIFLDGIYDEEQQDNSGTATGYDGVTLWTRDDIGDVIEGQFELWLNDNTYSIPEIVLGSDDEYYRSIADGNQGNDPTSSPTKWEMIDILGVWNTNITYAAEALVMGSDGILYFSLVASNLGNNPTTDTVNWKSYIYINNSPNVLDNTGFTAAVAAKALTFALKTRGLTDPTATDTSDIAFRSETLTTGDYDIVKAIAATSVVVPDGATLGFTGSRTDFVYLYGLNNAGTIELAVSGNFLDDAVLHTSVAIDATADLDGVLYSTTARSDAPIRQIGRIKIETGAVAGEWDNAPTELFVGTSIPGVAAQLAKAWVNFNGTGTVAINGAYNVSSITDNNAGDYSVNFYNFMSDTNYTATGMGAGIVRPTHSATLTKTTGVFQIQTKNTTTNVNEDANDFDVQFFGN